MDLVDIAPTVADVFGVRDQGGADREFQGRSLLPLIARDRNTEREPLWWFHDGHKAIRSGDWKLVSAKGGSWELYDLSKDRAEQHDLSASNEEKVAELEGHWTRQLEAF